MGDICSLPPPSSSPSASIYHCPIWRHERQRRQRSQDLSSCCAPQRGHPSRQMREKGPAGERGEWMPLTLATLSRWWPPSPPIPFLDHPSMWSGRSREHGWALKPRSRRGTGGGPVQWTLRWLDRRPSSPHHYPASPLAQTAITLSHVS